MIKTERFPSRVVWSGKVGKRILNRHRARMYTITGYNKASRKIEITNDDGMARLATPTHIRDNFFLLLDQDATQDATTTD